MDGVKPLWLDTKEWTDDMGAVGPLLDMIEAVAGERPSFVACGHDEECAHLGLLIPIERVGSVVLALLDEGYEIKGYTSKEARSWLVSAGLERDWMA